MRGSFGMTEAGISITLRLQRGSTYTSFKEETCVLSRICLNFGEEVALDVRALTKLPKGKETTPEYLARVLERGPRAIMAKLIDRLHNLRCLHSCTKEKRRAQIAETQQYHVPLLTPALHRCGEPWGEYASALVAKIEDAIVRCPVD